MQPVLPVLSFFILSAPAVLLLISQQVTENLDQAATKYCRLNLCDDDLVTNRAYDRQVNATPDSLQSATRLLTDLLVRDPAQPQRWADLGSAREQSGSLDKARACMDRALQLGPHSSDTLLTVGDFYLVHGDRNDGLRCLSRLLDLSTDRNDQVFSYFTARDVPPEDVLNRGLPPGSRAPQSYLRYLIRQPDLPAAQKVWRSIAARKLTDPKITAEYSTFLFTQSRFEEAADAWASEMTPPPSGYRRTEYVYNGGFETEPAPALFDWNITPVDHVEVSRETDARSGKWSLRIRFDGEANIDFSHIAQKTVLRTGTYRFQASVRTKDITTDQGVLFRITGMQETRQLTFEVETPRGTSGWRTVTGTFVLPQATRLVEIRVVRRPSWRFDNKINGTVWIDDVSLIRTGS